MLHKLEVTAALAASGFIAGSVAPGDVANTSPDVSLQKVAELRMTDVPTIGFESGRASESIRHPRQEVQTLTVAAEKTWTKASDARFNALAVQEALGEITAEERKELETLDALRGRHLSPPSGREVLRQYRARQVTSALMNALQEYVAFFGHAPTAPTFTTNRPASD